MGDDFDDLIRRQERKRAFIRATAVVGAALTGFMALLAALFGHAWHQKMVAWGVSISMFATARQIVTRPNPKSMTGIDEADTASVESHHTSAGVNGASAGPYAKGGRYLGREISHHMWHHLTADIAGTVVVGIMAHVLSSYSPTPAVSFMISVLLCGLFGAYWVFSVWRTVKAQRQAADAASAVEAKSASE